MATTLQEVIKNVHDSARGSNTLSSSPMWEAFSHIPCQVGTELLTLKITHVALDRDYPQLKGLAYSYDVLGPEILRV
jgi:hypothetical protein